MSILLTESEVRDICLEHSGDNQRARAIQLALIEKMRKEHDWWYVCYQGGDPFLVGDDVLAKFEEGEGAAISPIHFLPTPQELENES